ncbi:MAG: hypothetical protein AAFV25_27550, partial [Bacteroidota bacterium]
MMDDANFVAEQSSLEPGQIRFHDNFLPKLPAGPYSINVEQKLKGDGLTEKHFSRQQDFIVDGPRFVLGEEEVHSVYPPPNLQAHYQGVLPQVVLRKRNMPWERQVYSGSNKLPTPWVALMLFEPEELLVDDAPSSAVLRTRAVSRTSEEMLQPGNDYLPPVLTASPQTDEASCYCIDLDLTTFLALAPQLDELPYLSHVREVNTGDKEFLGMHADGWFGIVLGNRLPKVPAQTATDPQEELEGKNFARNIVHLVSIEGFSGYLAQNPEGVYKENLESGRFHKVRLASLVNWEFYCKPPEESFLKIMDRLGTGLLKVADTDGLSNEAVREALEGGYAPLQYNTRIGEKTMAWYRGPLLPVIEAGGKMENDTFFSAESGLIYDTDNGLFDASYATAWQIGRLLALSDAHFSQGLLNWKRMARKKISEFLTRNELQ